MHAHFTKAWLYSVLAQITYLYTVWMCGAYQIVILLQET